MLYITNNYAACYTAAMHPTWCMARLEGFEPTTYGLEVRSSIHLSYRRLENKNTTSLSFRQDEISSLKISRGVRKIGTHPIFHSAKNKAWHQNLGCQASQGFLIPPCPNSRHGKPLRYLNKKVRSHHLSMPTYSK